VQLQTSKFKPMSALVFSPEAVLFISDSIQGSIYTFDHYSQSSYW